ncbi:sigma-54 dependent transcriptional regulator [Tepidamorphus sp. 3E244]|uniref:sigma-54 dependent transcriptional regulator n=1 Tax=Tepidamorphus sp. 3E244 TaxID=3385498 RepID=UPI0038FC42B6
MRLALVTLDPAMERWIEAATAPASIDLMTVRPADIAMLPRLEADIVLVQIEAGRERDLLLLEKLVELGTSPVALAAGGSVNLAVDAMRRGASDFILQPAKADTLVQRLFKRLGDKPKTVPAARNQAARPASASGEMRNPFIGGAPGMVSLYKQIARIAPSSAPAFITGESGTGKELCASALHENSGRDPERFVAINCAAIPHELMESELFGHVRGAFTGAGDDKPGAMQLADGGTLFLDEICEMDLSLQAKLLRALQTRAVRRVGATADEAVNVRIVCATNRNPETEMRDGRFRPDLFYRLHVLPLHIPPLRERGDDILTLARAFLTRFAQEENRHFSGFSPQAERFLASYDWPGNVRQLENLVHRIVVMHDGETVAEDMIPLALAHTGEGVAASAPALYDATRAELSPLRVVGGYGGGPASGHMPQMASDPIEPFWMQEKRIIEQALEACGGHVGQAAAALGISASTIYRKKMAWDGEPALSA